MIESFDSFWKARWPVQIKTTQLSLKNLRYGVTLKDARKKILVGRGGGQVPISLP
jgi:hypothetical protein